MGLLSQAKKEAALTQRFENFVRKALETTFQVSSGTSIGSDFILTTRDGKLKAVVEAKLHRSTIAAPSTVKNAAARLQAAQNASNADVCILVLNTAHDPFIEAEAKNYGVTIYDAEILRSFAVSSSELAMEFEQIQQEAQLVRSPLVSEVVMPPRLEPLAPKVKLAQAATGEQIWAEIHALPPGSETAAAYEEYCERALKYLFEDDLTAWSNQKNTDALHRFDLIARISSRSDFWECLRDRFGGQYVVFEFKNYVDKITQAESTRPRNICSQRR